MREEYQKLYKEHSKKYGSNTCIFLEVGKFYEMYDRINPDTGVGETSMQRVTQLLNIQLTFKENSDLFAGVPEQSLHKYASVLTREGWTVVLVNQIKDMKGKVIERKVWKVLSPGTHIEAITTDALYIGLLFLEENSFTIPPNYAITVADISTGHCRSIEGVIEGKYDSWRPDTILHFFQVHPVKELLIVSKGRILKDETFFKQNLSLHNTLIHMKEYSSSQELIKESILNSGFQNKSLLSIYDFLNIVQGSNIEISLVQLLLFLSEHFPSNSSLLYEHSIWNPETTVFLGNNVLNQLNMISSNECILSYFKKTFTPMGKRDMLERILNPISDVEELNKRIHRIEIVSTIENKKGVEHCLKQISDLPRIHHKFTNYTINAQDILSLDQSYSRVLDVLEFLKGSALEESTLVDISIEKKIIEYRDFFYKNFDIQKALISNESMSFLQNTVGPKTYEIEQLIKNQYRKADEFLSNITKEAGLPPGTIKFENNFSIETTKKIAVHFDKVSKVSLSVKKSSVSIHSSVLESIQATCLVYQMKLAQVLKEELIPICNNFFDNYRNLWSSIENYISQIDILFTISNVCKERGFVKPEFQDNSESSGFHIKGLRHPLIESQNTRVEYVTHNVSLNSEGWLLYGMNASGKSSLMKAVGISVLLAQVGCFVPSLQMVIKPFKSIFTRILNQDNIWAGLSSFAVEMLELREILNKANEFSLVLGDELCSGTESVSATALVASGIVWLHNVKSSFIFATHLHGLNDLDILKSLKSLHIWHLKVHYDAIKDKLIYDRRLEKGPGNTYYGLEVAKAMNIPSEFLSLAHSIRKTILEEDLRVSSYNKNCIIYKCEICDNSISSEIEVHHIGQQKDAVNNILPSGLNKDHMRNLIVVCQKCHDKHHAGEIEIGSLKQTSEGLEREVITKTVKQKASKWSEEQRGIIKSYLIKFQNVSPKRIIYDLEKNEGIQISEQSLRSFKVL
uniref:DNA mismatch repair proteins mutS family domain-containing protein n=1 Tax=viral metagenome TaxID=1070528 RepID=A0A6C0IFL3_9ZZZZ